MPAPRYGEEFKRETVQRYRTAGKSYKELGRELGVSGHSIRKWVLEADRLEANPQVLAESEELKRWRRENRILREEREIRPLRAKRKAAAFFAMDAQSTR
jgi:transposase